MRGLIRGPPRISSESLATEAHCGALTRCMLTQVLVQDDFHLTQGLQGFQVNRYTGSPLRCDRWSFFLSSP